MAVRTSFTAGEVLAAADLTDTFGAKANTSALTSKANLASPTFTGTPAAPTAAAGTNTTQLATTAFVLGAGGLRLITPTSIANTGGTASLSGGAVTFTGVTSLSLNGCFTSTYANYLLNYSITGSNAGTTRTLSIRMRAAGTDESASSYENQTLEVDSTIVTGARTTTTSFLDALYRATKVERNITVSAPQLAERTWVSGTSGSYTTGLFIRSLSGVLTTSTSYDGISFIAPADNITGTIRVYGYNNG